MGITALRLKARVGPKGQAVIPKPIRDELAIRPGDEVYFSVHDGHVHLDKRRPSERMREFFDQIPDQPVGRHLSADEIKDAIEDQYAQRLGKGGR